MIEKNSFGYLANWEMLIQALFHPMVNAVKFNKLGGRIKLSLAIKASERFTILECILRDEGIGIPPENLKNLFQAFNISNQEKNQTSANEPLAMTQGIGMGLATAKFLAEVQGGEVHIKSEVGAYNELTLTIKVGV